MQNTNEIIEEAKRIEIDALFSARGHYEAARDWSKCHYSLGIPATVFAVVAGISAFWEYPIISVSISVVVGILTGLLTFLKPHERAHEHFCAGNKFNALKNDTRIFYEVKCDNSNNDFIDLLMELNNRRNNLNSESPQIPRRAYLRAKTGIESGEADYKISPKK